MTQDELNEILELHKKWILTDGKEGERADLRRKNLSGLNFAGVNLSSADMRWADLSWADMRLADLFETDMSWTNLRGTDIRGSFLIRTIFPDDFYILKNKYLITIQKEIVRVGCQCYSLKEWRMFSKQEIVGMDSVGALAFYPKLLDLLDSHFGVGDRPEWITQAA